MKRLLKAQAMRPCLLRATCAAALVAAFAGQQSAHAQGNIAAAQPPSAPQAQPAADAWLFEGNLAYRIWAQSLQEPDFGAVTADSGDEGSQGLWQRLRAKGLARRDNLTLNLEADLMTGQLAGPEALALPASLDAPARADRRVELSSPETFLTPRQLNLNLKTSAGQLQVGLQTSQWGLGLLANSGTESDAMQHAPQAYGGDRVVRALVGTAPLRPLALGATADNIYLALGADAVVSDENATWADGDRAYQGLGSLFYASSTSTVGTYVALRDQQDANGDALRVTAFDVHARHDAKVLEGALHLRASAEGVYLTGETTRSYAANGQPKVNLEALGLATQLEGTHVATSLGLRLLAGYASGDADSQDDTVYRFRFDPNYKVGLVLFERFLPAVTAQQYQRAINAERSARAPYGVEGLLNPGAVENALYVNPQVHYGRNEGFGAMAGVLGAWARHPLVDPYATFVAGGVPRGLGGEANPSTDLGWELNAMARYHTSLPGSVALEARADYGVLFPGSAFRTTLGGEFPAQHLLRARLGLDW